MADEKVGAYRCTDCGLLVDVESALTHPNVRWAGPGDKIPYHRWGHYPNKVMVLEFVQADELVKQSALLDTPKVRQMRRDGMSWREILLLNGFAVY